MMMMGKQNSVLCLVFVFFFRGLENGGTNAFSAPSLLSSKSVSQLLKENKASIDTLREQASKVVDVSQSPYSNDVFFLRYCLSNDNDEEYDAADALAKTLYWRTHQGEAICQAAQTAIQKSLSSSRWNNEPVLSAAPDSDTISQFLTPQNIITTTTSQGDLVYCVRAGNIKDVDLMSSLDNQADRLVQFFVYAREVHATVANQYSLESDRLASVLVANDLKGVKLLGGDASFRNALSDSSKTTSQYYPCLTGPAILLNLPKLLGALVKLFTPLFPPQVRKKIRFENGPLETVDNLISITAGGGGDRDLFLQQLDQILYQE